MIFVPCLQHCELKNYPSASCNLAMVRFAAANRNLLFFSTILCVTGVQRCNAPAQARQQ